jgi:hypothetical protein
MSATLAAIFNRRIRGFRVVHVGALACLSLLILCVYLTKASAGREAAAIATINKQIADEQRQVRLLKAELAHLEQPERLEDLSNRYLALGPIPAQRETMPDGLAEVARQGAMKVR